MKIVVAYMADYPPKSGASGADRRVRDIVRGLAVNGGDVRMLVPRRRDEQIDMEVDGYRISYVGSIRRDGLRGVLDRANYWRAVVRFARQEKPDWVLLYGVRVDAMAALPGLRRSGAKIAAEFCDLRSSGFKRDGMHAWMNWALLKADEELIPRATHLNIAISRYLIDHVRQRAPNVPTVRLPVLVDLELFSTSASAAEDAGRTWSIPADAPVFAYVGGLWKQEGVRYLVEGFAEVARKAPLARLIIAGRLTVSPNHDDIAGLVTNLGLGDKVVLPGWVSTDDVVAIYSRADVLVLPQIKDQFAVAALPTKLAEYSQVGKAIIATDVGDVGTYFTDGKDALLVDSENSGALAEAMLKLAGDAGLRQRLGEGARAVARENFDYRIAGRRVTEAMEAVAAGR